MARIIKHEEYVEMIENRVDKLTAERDRLAQTAEDLVKATDVIRAERDRYRAERDKLMESPIQDRILDAAVNQFVGAMKFRLSEKEAQGFHGWNNSEVISDEEILIQALSTLAKASGDRREDIIRRLVDAANYIMMLFHRNIIPAARIREADKEASHEDNT